MEQGRLAFAEAKARAEQTERDAVAARTKLAAEKRALEERIAAEAKSREEKAAAEAKAAAVDKIPQEYKLVAAKDAAMRSEFKAENERVRSIAARYNKAKQDARAQEQAKKDAANQKEAERVAIAQARKVARTAAAANIAQPLISGVAVFSAAAVAYNAMSPSSSSSLGPKLIGQKKKKRDVSQVKSDAKKIIGEAIKERDGKKVVDGFVDFLLEESRGSAPINAPKALNDADLLARATDEVAKFSEKKKRDMFEFKSDAQKIVGEAIKKRDGKKVVDGFVDFLRTTTKGLRGSAPANAPKALKVTDLLAKAKDEVAKFSEKKDAEDKAAAAAAAASSGQEAPKYPKGPNQLRAEAKASEEAAAAKAASGTPPVPPPATLSPPAPVSPAAPAVPVSPTAPAQVSPPIPAPAAPPAQPAVQNVPAQQKSYFPGSGGPPPGKKAGPGSYLDNL